MGVLRRKVQAATKKTGSGASDFQARIQQRAYSLYEKRGYSHGNDWSDWFEAERQIKGRSR